MFYVNRRFSSEKYSEITYWDNYIGKISRSTDKDIQIILSQIWILNTDRVKYIEKKD